MCLRMRSVPQYVDEHTHYLNVKLTRANAILTKLRNNMSITLLKTIFYSFFKPHVDYCSNIWTCASPSTLEPVRISMNKAVRIMTFSKSDEHADPLFKSLNILSFEDTVKYNLGKMMWKIHNSIFPTCLKNILDPQKNTKSTRNVTKTKKFR